MPSRFDRTFNMVYPNGTPFPINWSVDLNRPDDGTDLEVEVSATQTVLVFAGRKQLADMQGLVSQVGVEGSGELIGIVQAGSFPCFPLGDDVRSLSVMTQPQGGNAGSPGGISLRVRSAR